MAANRTRPAGKNTGEVPTVSFDARDRLAGNYDDMTVAQAIRWGVEVDP